METCGYISNDGVHCYRPVHNESGLCVKHLTQEGGVYAKFVPKNSIPALTEKRSSMELLHDKDEIGILQLLLQEMLNRYYSKVIVPERVTEIGAILLALSCDIEDKSIADRVRELGEELNSETRNPDDELKMLRFITQLNHTKKSCFDKEMSVAETVHKRDIEYMITSLIALIRDEIEDVPTRARLALRIKSIFGMQDKIG